MTTIRNTSHRPISVPLPGGRKLHLGPNHTGEIAERAADHPPLAALLSSGALEIVASGHRATGAAPGSQRSGAPSSGHHRLSKAGRRGDRGG
jgi:hypothetical protein